MTVSAVRYTVHDRHGKPKATKRFTGATLGDADHRGMTWAQEKLPLLGSYKRVLITKGGKRIR